MEKKFAVALLKGDDEKIMGVFNTKDEADDFGAKNRVPHDQGLQYCFSALFREGQLQGNSICIYNYYNVAPRPIYA